MKFGVPKFNFTQEILAASTASLFVPMFVSQNISKNASKKMLLNWFI